VTIKKEKGTKEKVKKTPMPKGQFLVDNTRPLKFLKRNNNEK